MHLGDTNNFVHRWDLLINYFNSRMGLFTETKGKDFKTFGQAMNALRTQYEIDDEREKSEANCLSTPDCTKWWEFEQWYKTPTHTLDVYFHMDFGYYFGIILGYEWVYSLDFNFSKKFWWEFPYQLKTRICYCCNKDGGTSNYSEHQIAFDKSSILNGRMGSSDLEVSAAGFGRNRNAGGWIPAVGTGWSGSAGGTVSIDGKSVDIGSWADEGNYPF